MLEESLCERAMTKLIVFVVLFLPMLGVWGNCDPDKGALCNKSPVYPAMSKRNGEEGTVLLRVLVTSEGRVGEIEVIQSTGFKRLDEAAIAEVKNWKFNLASTKQISATEWISIPVSFHMIDGPRRIERDNLADWIRVSNGSDIFVHNSIEKKNISPKSSLENNDVINSEPMGRRFWMIINFPEKEGTKQSVEALKEADCLKNTMFTKSKNWFSKPWAKGYHMPYDESDGIILHKWSEAASSSKDIELLKFVCAR